MFRRICCLNPWWSSRPRRNAWKTHPKTQCHIWEDFILQQPSLRNLNLAAVGLMFPMVSVVIFMWHFCCLNSAVLSSTICCLMGNYFWGSVGIEVEFLESRSWRCGSFISLAVEKVVPNVHKGYKEHLYITHYSISRPLVFYNISFSAVKISNSMSPNPSTSLLQTEETQKT